MIFSATTKDGRLSIKERISFENHLRELSGKDIIVSVEHRKGKKRSLEQNDLYYGILRKIMKVLIDRGYDALNVVMVNNFFKGQFLRDIMPDLVTGEDIEVIISPKDLGTKEFSEYIEKIIRFALQDMDIKAEWLEPYISKTG